MNAAYSLNLRRPDRRQELNQRHENAKIAKRSHLKEILTRNFFRRYPVPTTTGQIDKLRIESLVTDEIDKFL